MPHKGKVKCTLVHTLRLRTGLMAHTGSRGIALLFLDHGTRRGWEVSITPWPLFNPGKEPVPIVQEAGWAPGLVWTGVENLAPPPGFDPWTVQPIASCYTDYATQPTWRHIVCSRNWHLEGTCCLQLEMDYTTSHHTLNDSVNRTLPTLAAILNTLLLQCYLIFLSFSVHINKCNTFFGHRKTTEWHMATLSWWQVQILAESKHELRQATVVWTVWVTTSCRHCKWIIGEL